jgi:hypothetical protein
MAISGTPTVGINVSTTANDLASVAKTATFTLAITPAANGAQVEAFQLNATVVSGTTPTMDCQILESLDNGATYSKLIYQFERVTAVLSTPIMSKPLRMSGNKFEYNCIISGTTPSFTMALWRIGMPISASLSYDLYDRSLAVGSANVGGTTWFTEGCTTGNIIYYQSAVTTSPSLVYQISSDGVNWAPTTYTLTPSNSAGAYSIPLTAMSSKYGRIATGSVAGVGVTYGYSAFSCVGP